MKKEPLKLEQRVWLEATSMFNSDVTKLEECEVIEANQSSAFIVYVEDIDKVKQGSASSIKYHGNYLKRRVNQKTHEVEGNGWMGSYRIWFTKEAYEEYLNEKNEVDLLRQRAHEKINTMSYDELKRFV